MGILRGILATLTAVAAAAAVPAHAATVTIGSTLATPASANLPGCASGIDCVSFQTNAGTPVAVAPADGVITTWRIRAGSAGSPITLRVLRPGTGGAYTAVASSTPQTTAGTGATETFTASLPIDKGDIVALDNSSSALLYAPAASNLVVNWFQAATTGTAALADGSSGSPNQSRSSFELLMNADVVLDEADVTIAKSASADPVGVGQLLTYVITVDNAGPRPAKAVTVTDPLPGGLRSESVTPSIGSCTSGSTVTCTFGTLAPGAIATVAIGVRPGTAGTLVNTATVSTSTTETKAGNNSATTTTTVTAQAQPAPAPSLTMLKVRPQRVRRGKRATVSYVLTRDATVTLSFRRKVRGRYRELVRVTNRQARAGLNRYRLRTKTKRFAMPAGRYRVVAVATAGGKRSETRRTTLRLLKT